MMIKKLTFADDRNLWFTADTHFGHMGQALRRGYTDIATHDRDLVRNWNERVNPNDAVFHLGNFAWGVGLEYMQNIFGKLAGRTYLILGNHDDKKTESLPWSAPPQHRMLVQIGGQEIVLDHYAGRSWYKSHHGTLQFFGHSHGNMPATRQSCDVGLDAWTMAPITYSEITEYLAQVTLPLQDVQTPAPRL